MGDVTHASDWRLRIDGKAKLPGQHIQMRRFVRASKWRAPRWPPRWLSLGYLRVSATLASASERPRRPPPRRLGQSWRAPTRAQAPTSSMASRAFLPRPAPPSEPSTLITSRRPSSSNGTGARGPSCPAPTPARQRRTVSTASPAPPPQPAPRSGPTAAPLRLGPSSSDGTGPRGPSCPVPTRAHTPTVSMPSRASPPRPALPSVPAKRQARRVRPSSSNGTGPRGQFVLSPNAFTSGHDPAV